MQAQIDYPPEFQQKLEACNLFFIEPVEGKYKDRPVLKNDYIDIDFTIRSKKEDLEIRYAIYPLTEENALIHSPRVKTMQVISNVATNDQDAVITVHSLSEAILDWFGADWGAEVYFRPKLKFSSRKHCKMLSLYSEGKASVFLFFLFDKASKELDSRTFAIQFSEDAQ